MAFQADSSRGSPAKNTLSADDKFVLCCRQKAAQGLLTNPSCRSYCSFDSLNKDTVSLANPFPPFEVGERGGCS